MAIRLPFETTANHVIIGDEKLIHFRYFFTRKLMFLSQAEAVVLCPGGFGTMDEAFETLTLVQTGKAAASNRAARRGRRRVLEGVGPLGPHRTARPRLDQPRGRTPSTTPRIPPTPPSTSSSSTGCTHSSRYVRDDLVIRIRRKLTDAQVATLNSEFREIIKQGGIVQHGPYDVETDHLDLPQNRLHPHATQTRPRPAAH